MLAKDGRAARNVRSSGTACLGTVRVTRDIHRSRSARLSTSWVGVLLDERRTSDSHNVTVHKTAGMPTIETESVRPQPIPAG